MIIKNGYVWNGVLFEKKDLFIEDRKFVEFTESGPVVDATGLFVMPGWVDSHAHVLGTGMKLLTHDLAIENLHDILQSDTEEIIIARGWEELPDNFLIERMNEMANPVILIRKCGHVAWINNYLRTKLNFGANLIYEGQIEKVWSILGDDFYENAFKIGETEFLKYGVTQVHSDDFHGISFERLKRLLSNSKIRIFEKLYTTEPWKHEFGDFGISKIGGIKVFADGSLGGRTAYMFREYKNPGGYGIFTLPDNFDDIVQYAETNNLQVCVHTIGDRALHEVLERFERNKAKLKHRLIHLQFIARQDFERLKKYYLSIQPHFYFEDIPLLENISFEMGYPFLEMYRAGFDIAFSTDSPVSPADPKYVIESALKIGFSREDAIKLYTESGSKIVGLECGKIESGYYADFCLYDGDPFEREPIAVYVNGQEVLRR
ncbi:MAG: amidohydrolase family protein [Fervidobacterium sp.]|uniref:amidohydrolase family protein n=1 Tax=Fervidobacterium sp. TaxID=1871331 RepID=UPI00404AAFEF